MNATRETIEPAMRAAAEDVCGEHMEIVPADTRNLMGFYVALRKLLVEVRVTLQQRLTSPQGREVADELSSSAVSPTLPSPTS